MTQNIIVDNFYGVTYAGECLGCAPPAGTPLVVRNSLIGNRGATLWVSPQATFPIAFRQNNLFGTSSSCAITTSTSAAIDARQNFWGSATGPGFYAPANGVCSTNNVVRTTPFATAEISLN